MLLDIGDGSTNFRTTFSAKKMVEIHLEVFIMTPNVKTCSLLPRFTVPTVSVFWEIMRTRFKSVSGTPKGSYDHYGSYLTYKGILNSVADLDQGSP